MTSPFNECPSCGSPEVSLEGTYCWDCGYDSELEEAIANAQPLLTDQIEFEDESEWRGLFSDENIGKD